MTAKKLANFVLFQVAWFIAVGGASEGRMWDGPIAVLVFALIHLALIPKGRARRCEIAYVLLVGALGSLADSLMALAGWIVYPTSTEAWGLMVVPPWIISLWVAFALLPRFSLGWLAGRTWLAAAFGAIGGPLSFLAGTRFGAIGVGEVPLVSWVALSVEYAIATPLLLSWSPALRSCQAPEAIRADESAESSDRSVRADLSSHPQSRV